MYMDFLKVFLLILQTSFAKTSFKRSEKLYNVDDHLKLEHVQKVCAHRQQICESKDNNVCGFRVADKLEYVDFNNSCFLFMANMCDHPGKEYYIITSGRCSEYLDTRRMIIIPTIPTTVNTNKTNSNINKTTKAMGRAGKTETTFQTLYDVDTAFDYHICPHSCPNVYSPVCVGVNRGFGMYYKFYTFVNHCAGDLYYCKNWREFSPPPDEDEMVRGSPLSWSFCAANRYIQFARFSEMTSSMGHYGWLSGDYKPSHILRPNEREPGYG